MCEERCKKGAVASLVKTKKETKALSWTSGLGLDTLFLLVPGSGQLLLAPHAPTCLQIASERHDVWLGGMLHVVFPALRHLEA